MCAKFAFLRRLSMDQLLMLQKLLLQRRLESQWVESWSLWMKRGLGRTGTGLPARGRGVASCRGGRSAARGQNYSASRTPYSQVPFNWNWQSLWRACEGIYVKPVVFWCTLNTHSKIFAFCNKILFVKHYQRDKERRDFLNRKNKQKTFSGHQIKVWARNYEAKRMKYYVEEWGKVGTPAAIFSLGDEPGILWVLIKCLK